MILLDTNVVSEVFKGTHGASAVVAGWYARQTRLDLHVCAPVMAEMRFGVLRADGVRQRALTALYEAVREEFRSRIWSFDLRAAEAFAEIAFARMRAGRPAGALDMQIAAIAKSRGATVATRNVDHFDIGGVSVVDPWA